MADDLGFITSVPPGDSDQTLEIKRNLISPGGGKSPTDDNVKKELQEMVRQQELINPIVNPNLGKEELPKIGDNKSLPSPDPIPEINFDDFPPESKAGLNTVLQWQKQPGTTDQQNKPKSYWWVTFVDLYTTTRFEALVVTKPFFYFPLTDFIDKITNDFPNPYHGSIFAFISSSVKTQVWILPFFTGFNLGDIIVNLRPIDWIKLTNAQADAIIKANVTGRDPDGKSIMFDGIDQISI